MTSLEEVLSKAVKDSASDIFIVAGGYLSYKVDGEIRSMDESMKLTPTETSYFIDEIYSFAKRSKEYYLQQELQVQPELQELQFLQEPL